MYCRKEIGIRQLLFLIMGMLFFFDCFPQFGTTHFIVGLPGKKVSSTIETISREKSSGRRTASQKKQKNVRGGATLIDPCRDTQCFFTTIHDVADIIASVISQAKKSLYIAAFTLTDLRIANLIIEKSKQGLEVCIIVDASNAKQMYSKVQRLIDNGVTVLVYSPALNPFYQKNGLSEPLMHHKCIIIDHEIVITGSANLTKSGQQNNVENINILRDKQAVNEHNEEIKRLKQYCTQCKSSVS